MLSTCTVHVKCLHILSINTEKLTFLLALSVSKRGDTDNEKGESKIEPAQKP
jgi:hypothetical protein